jgi:excisionase family DNA binding protein
MRSSRDLQHTERSIAILEEPPLLMTVAGACSFLNCSRPTLYKLLNDGAIRSLKIGKLRRIPVSELEEFVERGLVAGRG